MHLRTKRRKFCKKNKFDLHSSVFFYCRTTTIEPKRFPHLKRKSWHNFNLKINTQFMLSVVFNFQRHSLPHLKLERRSIMRKIHRQLNDNYKKRDKFSEICSSIGTLIALISNNLISIASFHSFIYYTKWNGCVKRMP